MKGQLALARIVFLGKNMHIHTCTHAHKQTHKHTENLRTLGFVFGYKLNEMNYPLVLWAV